MRAARCSEVCERLANSVPNIEDRAIAAQVSLVRPASVTLQLIDEVEAPRFNSALGQAEGHRSVVGPLTRSEVEWAPTNHIVNFLEGARRAEFQSATERVAGRKAE